MDWHLGSEEVTVVFNIFRKKQADQIIPLCNWLVLCEGQSIRLDTIGYQMPLRAAIRVFCRYPGKGNRRLSIWNSSQPLKEWSIYRNLVLKSKCAEDWPPQWGINPLRFSATRFVKEIIYCMNNIIQVSKSPNAHKKVNLPKVTY